MKLAAKLLPLLIASTSLVAAPDFPPLTFPEGVGVNIHFTRGHERDLDMIRDGGFKFVRMDFGWAGIERKKGEFDWAAYDELTANLDKRGLRAIYILDYSNGLYEEAITSKSPLNGEVHRDTASPAKPESVAAFARWAAAAAARFKGRRVIWEIWNEPNIGFWKPKPNVKDYAALVLATCKAMREADPGATIVAPASSGFPWPFFEELFQAGALEFLDAVSVHPYRSYNKGPETAAEDYLRLRTMIERHAPAGKRDLPVLSGEWGYASHNKGVSLETQAAFIARQQIANVWQRVPVSIWYDWKNDGEDPAYNEHHFGTVSNRLAPKPAYAAVQTLARELRGFRIARRLDSAAEDFLLLLENDSGQQKLAAWTTGKPHTVPFPGGINDPAALATVNGQGMPVELKSSAGKLQLPLEAAPQYCTIAKPAVPLRLAASWRVDGFVPTRVLAGANEAVSVLVTNPLTHTVRAKLSLATSGGPVIQTLELAPSQSGQASLTLAEANRTAGTRERMLRVEFTDARGTALGSSGETLPFQIANPLSVELAATEKGAQFLARNPEGGAFGGYASLNGRRFPVRLGATPMEFPVSLPVEGGGPSFNVSAQLFAFEKGPATDIVQRKFTRVAATGMRASLDGDAKVRGTATIVETNSPGPKPPFARAHRLDYQFEEGWKFVECIAKGDKPALPGQPAALGLWVFGDGSGNALRMRVTDSAGQTFQPNGPALDWTGWRWVEFDLNNLAKAGHWGGANDGVPRGALKLNTLLLIDGSRQKTGGTVYFAGPVVVE